MYGAARFVSLVKKKKKKGTTLLEFISYSQASACHKKGLPVSEQGLSEKFAKAYKQQDSLAPNFGLGQMPSPRDWWRR
jgi:hypothetical protein